MKYFAFLTAFFAATLIVGEIRTERGMHCFGCTDVKCVVRFVDQHPLIALSHPIEIVEAFRLTTLWTDWNIPDFFSRQQVLSPETPKVADTQPISQIDFAINGIRFKMPEHDVIKHLRKPAKTTKGEEDLCAGGFHKYLSYDGLTIDLLSDDHGRRYALTNMEVTSPKWEIFPGIHIGDSIDKVRETLSDTGSAGEDFLSYGLKDQDVLVNFEFEAGKLVRVTMTETVC